MVLHIRRSGHGIVCVGGGHALIGADGRDDRQFVLHGIEDDDQRRPDHHRIGHVDGAPAIIGEVFDEADGVEAHVAEDPGRHRRQVVGQVDGRFGEEVAEGL